MPRPLIIIGAARSGTKFLRDTLAGSLAVAAIPYDITYVWRYGNESWTDDVLPVATCRDEVRQYIRDFVLKHAKPGHEIVVEKTVANALRVPFVFSVFPDAKYVHLIRDGRDVVESALRQWQSPVNWRYTLKKAREFPLRNYRYALWYGRSLMTRSRSTGRNRIWGPRYPKIEADLRELDLIEVCSKQWVACVNNATRDLAELPVDSVLTIKYEELVSDRSAWIEICRFAGIRDIDNVLAMMQKTVRPNTIGNWTARLDEELKVKMMPIVEKSLRQHGYN